jgi:hypothetical protein
MDKLKFICLIIVVFIWSDSATGIGAKIGVEYYINKLSFMMHYEFPFITDLCSG